MRRFTLLINFLKTPKGIAILHLFTHRFLTPFFSDRKWQYLNDDVVHPAATQEAGPALHQHQDPTDFRMSRIRAGMPFFRHYQHLPRAVPAVMAVNPPSISHIEAALDSSGTIKYLCRKGFVTLCIPVLAEMGVKCPLFHSAYLNKSR